MAQFFRTKSKSSGQKQQIVQLNIEQFDLHGQGVGWLNDKPLFVPGCLPGEQVNLACRTSGKKTSAKLLEVLEASPDRVTPFCPVWQQCGGCSLQHLAGQSQIDYKQQALMQFMQRKGVAVADWEPPLHSADVGYRRRARLAIDARRMPLKLGFRQEQSNRICDISHCAVLTPALNQVLQGVRQLLLNDPGVKLVGHVDLIDIETQAYACLWLRTAAEQSDIQRWQERAEQLKLPLLVCGAGQPDQLLSYPLQGLDISFATDSFIQVNADINQQMVERAMTWLDLQADDRLLDLFCGVGNFSLPAAQRCEQVVGVEGVAAMVRLAQRNASNNDLHNLEFQAADLAKPGWGRAFEGRFNKVLLDPARAGAEQVALEIASLKADSLLYVSCHPATLVRDARLMVQAGYKVVKACVMDMFPHTRHVESMMLFTRDQG